jgi:ABC-2 type transport system permease protein
MDSLRLAAAPILGFARMAFLDLLAYRLRYVVGVLNYVIYMGVQYFLWSAVYASAPGGEEGIGGFRFREIVTYFAVGWVVRVSTFNNLDRELSERVTQGDIVLDLLRPPSLLAMRYGGALGEAAFRIAFMGLPTALVLFPLFGVRAPAAGGSFAGALAVIAAFVASAVLAFHLSFLINFMVGASTVFFERIRGFLWAKFVLIQLLSGLLVPLDLFPPWARTVLEALPFRGTIHAPASIWLGRGGGAGAARELALQAAWTAVLWFLARRLWARARRKLVVQGG